MVDKVEAPDPTTVVFHLKFATDAFIPALADPYAWIYSKAQARPGHPLVRKEHRRHRALQVRRLRDRPVDHRRCATRTITTPACPISTGSRASSPTSRSPASRRSAATARRSSSAAFRRPCATSWSGGARRQDHGADQRLELRRADHAEPQEKAVRRCPRAPRADAGDRPLGHARRNLSKIAIVHTVGGAHLPGSPLAATKEELREDRRLLARYREIARRGAAAVEGSRRRRISASRCSTAQLDQPYKYYGIWVGRRMEPRSASTSPRACCRPGRGSRRCAPGIST